MRKKHGMKPSDKEFYQDPIYKETTMTNKKIYEMRESHKYLEAPNPNFLDGLKN
jgi:hypothetical protein